MNAAPVLIAYTAALGFAAPYLMVRSSWPHRAPALAAAVWHALTVAFSIAATLAAYNLAVPTEHLHVGLVGLLHSCGLDVGSAHPDPDTADRLAVALAATIVAALAASFAFHLVRARRARTRHRKAVDLVGRHSPHLNATVLPYDVPAAYCLPGMRPRIVISDAAVRRLTPEQLDAVLAHEQSHVTGRHHLALIAMEAFRSVFRRLPLARHAQEQTALLLEMVADDRALRSHSQDALASVMYEMAEARTPVGAFAAGGQSVLIRLQRVLGPRRTPHPTLWGAMAAAVVTAPLLPLVIACPAGLG